MIDTQLPQHVITYDHHLEETAERASTALMEHRWHWTLDESNPERVSVREYARLIGRSATAVQHYAQGFVVLRDNASVVSPNEARERAAMSVEQEVVADAVASARGISLSTVRQAYGREVRHVRDFAREQAEKHGTSVETEAQQFAEFLVKTEHAQQGAVDDRLKKHDFRFFELEKYLANALRYLAKADQMAGTLSWDEEEKEILTDIIAKVEQLTHRCDARIAGLKAVDIDWDKELATILAQGD